MASVNVNVGVMGHVDSGKTSLVGALSTCLSTCALDRHPQSKERGITLDLGFSSFVSESGVRFTLVDCPGHASLIRTIIGATQIIDVFLLVIDCTKGIQTQTAECLVLAQVSPCSSMVVVLNKVDLLPESEREKKVERLMKIIGKALSRTKFRDCEVVTASAKQGTGVEGVAEKLAQATPQGVVEGRGQAAGQGGESEPLVYAVDHCFSIKGQGTVLTGTVLQGAMRVNQNLSIPRLGLTRKVKSMQVFKQPVEMASSGERVAICTTQLDPKLIERDYLCDLAPEASKEAAPVRTFDTFVARARRVAFYKGSIPSGCKIHVTLGHITALAEATFFAPEGSGEEGGGSDQGFDYGRDYEYLPELVSDARPGSLPPYVLIVFEKPVTCPTNTAFIASRLDLDVHTKQCRLAFHGNIVDAPSLDTYDAVKKERNAEKHQEYLNRLRVFKVKNRAGKLERIEKGTEGKSCIVSGFFGRDSDISKFIGYKVFPAGGEGEDDDGETAGGLVAPGTLVSAFGKSGKVKVQFDASVEDLLGADLRLQFKKYVYNKLQQR
ncbi:selenocysteine-specific elongation factor [Chloropicon primus]|uniref:Selenocysteine-specific elongation factor n=1 Tax=Chloropicon primus TaxID=1764295 RepID=A0A5B8N1R7_9CHLO|nr:selenocysteine-specific elongation factor [Chloropicon primus]|eukprot:QDZ25644.1 selenocysteine-specific elongation factor [Chloropicon primus]